MVNAHSGPLDRCRYIDHSHYLLWAEDTLDIVASGQVWDDTPPGGGPPVVRPWDDTAPGGAPGPAGQWIQAGSPEDPGMASSDHTDSPLAQSLQEDLRRISEELTPSPTMSASVPSASTLRRLSSLEACPLPVPVPLTGIVLRGLQGCRVVHCMHRFLGIRCVCPAVIVIDDSMHA